MQHKQISGIQPLFATVRIQTDLINSTISDSETIQATPIDVEVIYDSTDKPFTSTPTKQIVPYCSNFTGRLYMAYLKIRHLTPNYNTVQAVINFYGLFTAAAVIRATLKQLKSTFGS